MTMSRADALGRGRGERVERDAGKVVAQPPQLPVLRTEIVPPLADAVRLVDGDEPHAALLQQPPQRRAAFADQPLGRHVQQPAAVRRAGSRSPRRARPAVSVLFRYDAATPSTRRPST